MPGSDPRPWFAVTIGASQHPKIAGLTDAQFRAWFEIIEWCAREKTDGVIPRAVADRLWKPSTVIKLQRQRLLEDADNDHLAVHDYLDHQMSRVEIDELSGKRARSGGMGGHERWHVRGGKPKPDCDHCIAEGLVPRLRGVDAR